MQPSVQVAPDSWPAIESPEFAVRFGRLLTKTRRRSRSSIKKLASAELVGFDASQLRQFEQGSTTIDESIIDTLCRLYSADVGRILPARRPVVVADGRISGAGVSVEFSPDDPTSLMVAYLRLIRRMRNLKMAPAIALRRDDILILAHYLDIDGADVVDRLSTLMNVSPAQRTTMAMLFASGAIVIGLAAGGHVAADGVTTRTHASDDSARSELVVESQPDLPHDGELVVTIDAAPDAASVEIVPPVTASVDASVTSRVTVSATSAVSEIATTTAERTPAHTADRDLVATASTEPAAVVETAPVAVIARPADVVGLSTATRVRAPVAVPPLTVAAESATANRSGCNPDPSEAVMSVVIPDIAYTCPVYAGGQSMIDAGFVTLVTDAGANPVLATRPGEPGTLWLAGHRTTHGAAFSEVPDLADGALVSVSSGDATATYRVVGRSYVEVREGHVIDASGHATSLATWASIIRDDFSGNLAPRLVLQTCEGANFRWMVYADLVT